MTLCFASALEGLEVSHPVVAELLAQRRAVEVEPGGLQVDDDPQLLHLLDRFGAHEIGVRDAGAHVVYREIVAVDALVGVDHVVYRAVALRSAP